MKISKKTAKNMLIGWDILKSYKGKKISKEEYIDKFFETLKEDKIPCNDCSNNCKICSNESE